MPRLPLGLVASAASAASSVAVAIIGSDASFRNQSRIGNFGTGKTVGQYYAADLNFPRTAMDPGMVYF
eukprot:765698-Hanusia_phi.AAC.4